MAVRHYSRELLAAQRTGHAIVSAIAPYAATPVDYAPRRNHDPRPWAFTGADGITWRYRGSECMAVDGCKRRTPTGAPCKFPRDHDKACQPLR